MSDTDGFDSGDSLDGGSFDIGASETSDAETFSDVVDTDSFEQDVVVDVPAIETSLDESLDLDPTDAAAEIPDISTVEPDIALPDDASVDIDQNEVEMDLPETNPAMPDTDSEVLELPEESETEALEVNAGSEDYELPEESTTPEFADEDADLVELPKEEQTSWEEGEVVTINHDEIPELEDGDEFFVQEGSEASSEIPELEDDAVFVKDETDTSEEYLDASEDPEDLLHDSIELPDDVSAEDPEGEPATLVENDEAPINHNEIPALEDGDEAFVQVPPEASDDEIPELEDDAVFVKDEIDVPEDDLELQEEPEDLLHDPIELPEVNLDTKPSLEDSQADVATLDANSQENVDDTSTSLDEKFTEQTDAQYQDEELHTPIDEGLPDDTEGIQNLDDIQGWLSDVNPNFDPLDYTSPYSENCGSCALAVERRLDGDQTSVASADNIGTVQEMNDASGMEQTKMTPGEIEDYLIEQGPGSHGIVGIDREVGSGHWFNAYYDGKNVIAIDGQNGSTQPWPPDYGDVTNWDFSIGTQHKIGGKHR